jgi:hypothetical protein
MPIFSVGLSYPKPRDMQWKVVPLTRGDSSTVKTVIPKDAVIAFVMVHQTVAAVTTAPTVNLGTSGTPTGLLNAFSIAITTPVGLVTAGTTTGALVGTKLAADATIISTHNGAGTSGAAVAYIGYYMAGPGEDPTD